MECFHATLSPVPPRAVSFDDIAGVWRETQNLTSRDGLVTSQARGMPTVSIRSPRRLHGSLLCAGHAPVPRC